MKDKFDELALKSISGEATPDEQASLRALTEKDSALRKRLSDYQRLVSALGQFSESLPPEAASAEIPPERLDALMSQVSHVSVYTPRPSRGLIARLTQAVHSTRAIRFAVLPLSGLVITVFVLFIAFRQGSPALLVNDPIVRGLDRHGRLLCRRPASSVTTNLLPLVIAELRPASSRAPSPEDEFAIHTVVTPQPKEAVLGPPQQGKPAIILLSPVATAVRTNAVTLRWAPQTGVREYEVSLRSTKERRTFVAADSQFALTDLDPGQFYEWRVSASIAGSLIESDWARFRVLALQQQAELSKAESLYKDSPLVSAALYRRFGVKDDYRRARERFLAANPSLRPKNNRL